MSVCSKSCLDVYPHSVQKSKMTRSHSQRLEGLRMIQWSWHDTCTLELEEATQDHLQEEQCRCWETTPNLFNSYSGLKRHYVQRWKRQPVNSERLFTVMHLLMQSPTPPSPHPAWTQWLHCSSTLGSLNWPLTTFPSFPFPFFVFVFVFVSVSVAFHLPLHRDTWTQDNVDGVPVWLIDENPVPVSTE